MKGVEKSIIDDNKYTSLYQLVLFSGCKRNNLSLNSIEYSIKKNL